MYWRLGERGPPTEGTRMWRQFWKEWTVDKPAAFGDWLWDVFCRSVCRLSKPTDCKTSYRVHSCFNSSFGLRASNPDSPGVDAGGRYSSLHRHLFDDSIGQLYDALSSDFCPCPAGSGTCA